MSDTVETSGLPVSFPAVAGWENEDLNMVGETIVDMIAYVREYANTQMAALDGAIDSIQEQIGDYNPLVADVDTSVPTVDRPSFPLKPTFGTLDLDESWPDSNIADPVFQEYGLMDFDYVAPTPPQEIDEAFAFAQGQYTSDMWQTLFSHVHSALLNGDYTLPQAVHDALVARERESRRQNQDREYRAGMAAVGAMGWNLPAGHSAAFLSEFHGEVLKRDQDGLNNIIAEAFKIAHDWRKTALVSAVDLEKMLRDTFEKAQGLGLEAAKAAKEYVARFFAENVKLYIAKWEGVKLKLEALKTQIEAIASRNESETKVFVGRAQVLESRIKAITEKNRGKVEARKGEVDIYTAEVGAVRDEYMALVEEIRVNQQAAKVEMDAELRKEEMRLLAFSDKTKMAEQFALGVAKIRAQGVASALGAINTSISNGYHASDTRQRRFYVEATTTAP